MKLNFIKISVMCLATILFGSVSHDVQAQNSEELSSAHSLANQKTPYRLTLKECMELAQKNHFEIKSKRFDVQKILAQKIESTKRYVPVVKYKYNFAPVPQNLDSPFEALGNGDLSVFNSFRVEMGAPITTFGRLQSAQLIADLGVDLTSLQIEQKTNDILLNVYKLYNGVLLARELRGLGQQAMDALEKNIHELEKSETTDQIQILKMKVVLYEVQRRMSEANMKEALALATLKMQLGLDDRDDFDVRTQELTRENFKYTSVEEILPFVVEERPEYEMLDKTVSLRDVEVVLAKKEYRPKLLWGAFAEYGYAPAIRGDSDANEFTNPFNYSRAGVGLELSGELDFRKLQSKLEVAKVQFLKAKIDREAGQEALSLDLKKDFEDLKHNRYLLSRADEEKKTARQIVFLTKSNLDIGLGEAKDYYEALQSYLLLEARSLEAVFYYNNAVATLKVKMGQLHQHENGVKHEE